MYTVELYARVRREVYVEGKSERQVASGVWAGAGNRSEDVAVFGAAGLPAAAAGQAAEAGSVGGSD